MREVEAFEMGRRTGKQAAMRANVLAAAATPEDARLVLDDLDHVGVGCMDDRGKRVEPPALRRFDRVRFDEERRTFPK